MIIDAGYSGQRRWLRGRFTWIASRSKRCRWCEPTIILLSMWLAHFLQPPLTSQTSAFTRIARIMFVDCQNASIQTLATNTCNLAVNMMQSSCWSNRDANPILMLTPIDSHRGLILQLSTTLDIFRRKWSARHSHLPVEPKWQWHALRCRTDTRHSSTLSRNATSTWCKYTPFREGSRNRLQHSIGADACMTLLFILGRARRRVAFHWLSQPIRALFVRSRPIMFKRS